MQLDKVMTDGIELLAVGIMKMMRIVVSLI